jgi:hypothetical protein
LNTFDSEEQMLSAIEAPILIPNEFSISLDPSKTKPPDAIMEDNYENKLQED